MTQSPSLLVIRQNVTLAPYTTLGIGGPARFFAEPATEAQVSEALEFADAHSVPVFILGGGSNLVVSDEGFAGLVIKVALRGIDEQAAGLVTAAAGEDWDPFVRRCVEQDLAGIECLSGIPGTVGGTPIQNVGAYGQEVSDVITSVRVLDRRTQRVLDMSNEQCGFSYRTSVFNSADRDLHVVLSATYRLHPGGSPQIAYPDLVRHFAGRAGPPCLAEVREAILGMRGRKSMVIREGDPDSKSAGSFFKNPMVPAPIADRVEEAARSRRTLTEGETMPRYPMPDGLTKLSAAWLIQHAGFAKGYTRGPVGLSSKHTLALINRGGASAADLLALMSEIQSTVRSVFGVDLTPEPVFIGF